MKIVLAGIVSFLAGLGGVIAPFYFFFSHQFIAKRGDIWMYLVACFLISAVLLLYVIGTRFGLKKS